MAVRSTGLDNGTLPAHVRRQDVDFLLSRPPRLGWLYSPPVVVAPEPPPLPPPPEGWQAILLSALGGAILTLVTALAYGSNPVMVYVSAASFLITILAVGQQLVSRSRTLRIRRDETARYRARLHAFEQQLEQAVRRERVALLESERPIDELVERCISWDDRLWERRPAHTDFLRVRLGTGTVPSQIAITLPSSPSDLATEAEDIANRHRVLLDAPFCLDLARTCAVLGMCGDKRVVGAAARAIVCTLAALHGPDDLRIAILAAPDGADPSLARALRADWRWAKWLPHTAPPMAGGAERTEDALLACQPVRRRYVLSRLAAELRRRNGAADLGSVATDPIVLVVATDPHQLIDSPVGQELIGRGPERGFRFLILSESATELPGQCNGVLTLHAGDAHAQAAAQFALGSRAQPRAELRVDLLEPGVAEQVARTLSPLLTYDGLQVADLPASTHLVSVLGIEDLQPADIGHWWVAGEREPTIRATLGVSDGPDGRAQTLELDLEREGPHGLVAGTTGSGKSELLLTLLLSLAVRFHPHRVAFLLVDYKGGAAFGPTTRLPHTLGLVTDLDEQLAHRSLVALKAELKRRERLFREYRAANIAAYQSRAGAPPLPHLLVVIDELAQLLKEVPSFVDGLVSVAQTGRSLGVHLVLATQKPEGVVAGPIQANTNFRICLRVVDPGDSTNMIGSPDAAAIPPTLPGRGYLRVAQEPLRVFQAARVAGMATGAGSVASASFFTPDGLPVVLPRHLLHGSAAAAGAPVGSDLERLVAAVCSAADHLEVERLPSPWPDPLPEWVALYRLAESQLVPELPGCTMTSEDDSLIAILGLQDRPAEQWQGPFRIDLRAIGHVLALGAFASGTDMALTTLATSLCATRTPDDLHVYGVDFGAHALAPLARFPHCGGVIGAAEAGKIRRLFRELGDLAAERKRLIGRAGAQDWTEYRRRREVGEQAPYVLLLIDNFSSFAEAHEGLLEQLAALLRDARAVGLHVAVGADQLRALPVRLAALFEGVLVLRQTEPGELGSLTGLRGAEIPTTLPRGRGFWRTTPPLEVQVAQPVDNVPGEAPQDALQRAAEVLSRQWTGERAPQVRVLPDVAVLADLLAAPGETGPSGAAFALDGDSLTPVRLDLVANPTLIVAGPPRSGRSTALATCLRALTQSHAPGAIRAYVVTAKAGLPRDLQATACQPADLESLLEDLASAAPSDVLRVLVLDDYDLIASHVESSVLDRLGGLMERARALHLAVMLSGKIADLESRYDDATRAARKAGHALVLSPRERSQVEAFGAIVPRELIVDWVPGRAFYVVDGQLHVVQVALAPAEP
ncbi:MAG TPA: FtsK/SpoIIIE domain-containing protein [Chloroflexota bacterium]|nr:FtsK/SpoIIIE domain-containing protein [Chloroflexota bacterium]